MGSRRHGNDDSVALTRSTLRQAQERLRPFDKVRRAGDGFPSSRERRFSCPHAFDPSTSSGGLGMGSRSRPVSSTGQALRGDMPSRERRFSCPHAFDPWTRSGGPGMGSRPRPVSSTGQALRGGMPSRERRFGCSRVFDPWTRSGGPGMGSRRHGNDDSVPFGRLRAGSVFSSRRERRLERHARSLDRRWPGDRRCAGVRPERVRCGVRGAGADAGRAAGHAGRGDIERGRGCGGGTGVQSNP